MPSLSLYKYSESKVRLALDYKYTNKIADIIIYTKKYIYFILKYKSLIEKNVYYLWTIKQKCKIYRIYVLLIQM